MKNIIEFINEKLKVVKNNKKSETISFTTVDDLKEHIKQEIKKESIKLNNGKIFLDLTNIDISNLNSIASLFNVSDHYIKQITTIDVSNWNTSNIESFYETFFNLYNLEKIIGIEDWDISNAKDMVGLFAYCKKLKLNLENWDIPVNCITNDINKSAPNVKFNEDVL